MHADRRGPHVEVRHEALHARRRADPDPRRRRADRRARPPPLRHDRRLGAVARQARAAGLPAAGPGGGRQRAAVSYMEELYPVTVGSVDATSLFDPANERIRDDERPRLHQAGPRPRRGDRCSPTTACRSTTVARATRSARTRSARSSSPSRPPAAPAARRPCSRSATPTPSSSCATRSRWAARRAVLVEADAAAFGPADVAREIADVVREHEAAGRRYDLVLLGNDAADTGDFQVGIRLAYVLDRPVVTGVSTRRSTSRTATSCARGDGARRRRRSTSRRCRPC